MKIYYRRSGEFDGYEASFKVNADGEVVKLAIFSDSVDELKLYVKQVVEAPEHEFEFIENSGLLGRADGGKELARMSTEVGRAIRKKFFSERKKWLPGRFRVLENHISNKEK